MAVELQTLIDRSIRNMGSGVHPRVKEYAIELVKRSYKKGIYVQITSGYRSNAEQTRLYNQGRTPASKARGEIIVTNAKAGQSIHNYGLAIDYALLSSAGVMHWDIKRDMNANQIQDWFEVAAIGKSMGFQWGGDWKSFRDYPHLDMQKGLSLSQLAAGKRPTIPPLSNVMPVVNDPWAKGYLQAGDHGPAIGQLQKDLNAAGANPQLAIDNNFGVAVKNRVITFQKKHGLAADGVYGSASKAKMKSVLSEIVEASAVKPKEEPKLTKPREVSPSHAEAWKRAQERGYLNGEKPGESVSREQLATVLQRVEENDEKLNLTTDQRKEYALIFKLAREKGVFTSGEHEKTILDGSMTKSRLEYLQMVISGASLNGGKRVK